MHCNTYWHNATGRKIAEMWNSKTPKEKEPFEKEAVVLREKFLVMSSRYQKRIVGSHVIILPSDLELAS